MNPVTFRPLQSTDPALSIAWVIINGRPIVTATMWREPDTILAGSSFDGTHFWHGIALLNPPVPVPLDTRQLLQVLDSDLDFAQRQLAAAAGSTELEQVTDCCRKAAEALDQARSRLRSTLLTDPGGAP